MLSNKDLCNVSIMKIKELQVGDDEILNQIYNYENFVFGKNGGADMWLLKSFLRYGKIYVGMKGDNIVSVAEFEASLNRDEIFLYGFFTVDRYRNLGYGKRLLIESEKYLKKLGIRKILLTVAPENKIAIALYEKLNYTKEKYLENEYGIGIDRYLMSKKIGD